jgi:hypothetical protein
MSSWASAAAAVAARPRLWPTAVAQVRRLAPQRWWSRRPFLPVPDRAWLRFRMETQYGDPAHRPEPDDVVAWLEWARASARHGAAAHR